MGAERQPSRVMPVVITTIVGIIMVATIVSGVGGAYVATVNSDLFQALAAVFAGIVCLRVGPRSDRHGWVRGWRLIGYGMFAWAAGDVLWSYYEVVRDVPGPQFSLADVGFLAMVPLVLWGLGCLIGLYRGPAMGLIEGLIIALSLLFLSWATVLGPTYGHPENADGPMSLWAINVAYPLGDVAIAAAALILLGSVLPGHRAPVALLAAGMLALSVSDSTYVGIADTYRTGHVIDTGWVIGFLLVAVAGLLAARAPRVQDLDPATQPRTWFGLPYIPLALAAVTSIVLAATAHSPSLVLAVLLVALFALVVARQVLALRERRMLAANLHDSLRQVRQQQEVLNELAFTDSLTGLANRAMFEGQIAPADRARTGNTTVMFIDLDRFKEVNDVHGHDTGDAVLVAAALRLRKCCRAEDTVARVGGDEFVVLTQGVAPQVVEQIAQRFLTAMRQPVEVAGRDVAVSASIGVATGDTADVDVHELIRRADAAMYVAKLAGRGRYATYPTGVAAPDLTVAPGPIS